MNQTNTPPSSPLRKTNTGLWVAVIVVALATLAALGWLAYTRLSAAARPAPLAVAPAAVVAPAPPSANADDADALLAAEAKAPGLAPQVAAWLAEPGMLRRLAAAVWQVSQGESPREPLRFLAPRGGFSVVTKDGRTFMSPASAARYDFVATALGSLDAAQAGAVYARARPFFQAAFREISPPDARFDKAVDRALERLAAVPLTDAPLEVAPMEVGVGYRFTDPALEALDPVQKHLLRMGPANARVVLTQLRSFRGALHASP
jgi:hypothetical protein